MTKMLTGNEAREGILRGIRKVADAVLPTLGGGSGVIIEQKAILSSSMTVLPLSMRLIATIDLNGSESD